jgi:hypothetical protein
MTVSVLERSESAASFFRQQRGLETPTRHGGSRDSLEVIRLASGDRAMGRLVSTRRLAVLLDDPVLDHGVTETEERGACPLSMHSKCLLTLCAETALPMI